VKMIIVFIVCMTLFNAGNSFTAAVYPEPAKGKLYIQNDHPLLQFECKYKIGQEERGPINIYKQEVFLGPIQDVTDVQISRYGKSQLGAQYWAFPEQLAECKKRMDQNCVLHIVYSITKGWTVEVNRGEVREAKIITKPLEYFEKANAYGDKAEPRYVLNLGEPYTAKQIDERQRTLRAEIERSVAPGMREQVLQILNAAVTAAKALLDNPKESTKILLVFRARLHPENITEGRKIACALFTGQRFPNMDQEAYLNAIIDLVWFYYDMAVDKNQAFSEGTFVLQDQDGRIYKFLLEYVRMVNPDAIRMAPAFGYPKNIYLAYARHSTHFPVEQDNYRQYGIDIRFANFSPQFLLPTHKSHLLFGRISQDLIYIKMEDFGVCSDQLPKHGTEYGVSLLRKLWPAVNSYLEGYIPTKLNELEKYYIGTDDDPLYRKEHVPAKVLSTCFEILQRAHLQFDQQQQIILKFIQQGIHGILDEINKPASPIPQAQKNELQRYLTTLQVNEGLDHQDIRRGREVIITNNDLTVLCLAAMRF